MNAAVERQVSEAVIFARDNAEGIARVAELLKQATDAFVEKLCRRALPEEELEDVIAAVACGDMIQVFNLVRPQASRMRAADVRDVYWDWIDAVGFYFDALGCNWPYMTQGRRLTYLFHAEESALIVCTK